MTQANLKQVLNDDPLLSEAEVAEYLRCAPATLKMKRLNGKGPASIKLGNLIRYRQSAVQAFLDASTAAGLSSRAN